MVRGGDSRLLMWSGLLVLTPSIVSRGGQAGKWATPAQNSLKRAASPAKERTRKAGETKRIKHEYGYLVVEKRSRPCFVNEGKAVKQTRSRQKNFRLFDKCIPALLTLKKCVANPPDFCVEPKELQEGNNSWQTSGQPQGETGQAGYCRIRDGHAERSLVDALLLQC